MNFPFHRRSKIEIFMYIQRLFQLKFSIIMKKILLTGGSGLVGKALTVKLISMGYEVNWLSRSSKPNANVTTYIWNPETKEIDEKAFQGVSHIVHLAGANISEKAWTTNYKKIIVDSRIQTSQMLFDYVKRLQTPLKSFMSSSAIGYYGTFTSEKILTENSPSGDDFLAKVCTEWENKALQFQKVLNVRTVCIRTGIVIANNGGAFPKIKKTIALGLGAPLGNGQQYMPWIHIDDLVDIYIKAIEDNSLKGCYNATAPQQITNKQFTEQTARELQKKLWLPKVPSVVLQLIFGQRADLLLKGTQTTPYRLLNETDFKFSYENFLKAIHDIIHAK